MVDAADLKSVFKMKYWFKSIAEHFYLKMLNFVSPLEQFTIFPMQAIILGPFDLSFTNQAGILILLFVVLVTIFVSLSWKDGTFNMIPTRWQSFFELMYKAMLSLVVDNVRHNDAQKFFPLVFTIFFGILSMNLIGLVPYSFTATSHLIVTFAIALSIFIGINIVCVRQHGIKFFGLFLPPGTGVGFAFLLVPIEFISYMFKPISLSVRLFANMMAGHTLLKVIAGFGFLLMLEFVGFMWLLEYFPLLVLIPLFGLELAVAVIQAFVFSILICIYLNDALNMH